MTVKVVNKYKEAYDVYIGRGSLWGNPFTIINSAGDTREVVIEKYQQHLWRLIRSGEISISQLKSLDGKTLGCFCKPQACHGDVIARAVEWAITYSP